MWLYDGKQVETVDLDKYLGFVYNIENLETGQKYIGKKLFLHQKTKQVKGKKKKILIESDWQTYWGSNKRLQEDVKTYGESNFRRTILRLCKSKGECSYFELWYQMMNHVLLNECYYNDYIRVRISSTHVKNVKP